MVRSEAGEALLDLAIEDPEEASRRAREVLSAAPDHRARSFAHHCLGIVHRDQGLIDDALRELRTGIRLARTSGDPDRVRDVKATYGTTLVLAGRPREGVRVMAEASSGARGELGAKVLMRHGAVLAVLGRYAESVPLFRRAVAEMVAVGNRTWEARSRIWLGHAHSGLGEVDDAEREIVRALRILEADPERTLVERLSALENLAEIAAARNDIAACLRMCGVVVAGYRDAGRPVRFDATMQHALAHLGAGLAGEAADLLRSRLAEGPLSPADEAELHLVLASALTAQGDPPAAATAAARARMMFEQQERGWYALRARLAALRALDDVGDPGLRARAEAADVAGLLDAERAHEAPVALTLAGRWARGPDRRTHWDQAASYRDHPNALVRAGAWHAQALAREETGERGGVLRAAGAGLDAIDEHRRLIGSSELRALATTHGRELTTIALRHAATDPRTLLRWSERTRATALAQPPATSDAATISPSLAALRDNGRRLAEARQDGDPTEDLEKERLRLERAVRAESHTSSADSVERQRPVSAEEVVTSVGDGCLVELVDVDGTLHVLVVHGGRVRRRVAGSTAEVGDLLGPAAMLLRRTSRGRPADLAGLGQRLQEAILGDAVRLIPEGAVVLAPTARLHGLPWALLPVLNDRPFSVVPSAGQLLRARATPRPADPRTVLITGPGLATGGAEVPVLAERHPDAVLLDGAKATLEAVLAQLDGADLVHLAAHGRFRADSPLFSALDLADGPLTVHDLERLQRAPYRVVLSACESGVLAPVGAEELLGLAAALFSLGTAGLVSSVAEVNDTATADLMVDLHAALAAGSDPATALHEVRRATVPGSVEAATAAAFLALGV